MPPFFFSLIPQNGKGGEKKLENVNDQLSKSRIIGVAFSGGKKAIPSTRPFSIMCTARPFRRKFLHARYIFIMEISHNFHVGHCGWQLPFRNGDTRVKVHSARFYCEMRFWVNCQSYCTTECSTTHEIAKHTEYQ